MLSADVQLHRLSVADVYRMAEAGILGEEQRVELLDGVLVDMSPPGSEHSATVARLTRHLATSLDGAREVRVQDMLLVEGGFVMPDLMVVEPPPRGQQPSTAALVIEVTVTTHAHDTAKASRYARAGVDEYWLVDLPGRGVQVHRDPVSAGYRQLATYRDGDTLAALTGVAPIEISHILGPVA